MKQAVQEHKDAEAFLCGPPPLLRAPMYEEIAQ